MPRVLLTGASGFIGQAILTRLCETDWSVAVLRHERPVGTNTPGCPQKTYDVDIRDETTLDQVEVSIDVICHTAAFIPQDYSDPALAAHCFDVNAMGTLNLLQWAVDRGVRRFVYISTAAVYAPCSQGLVAEGYPTHPAHRATYYAASKLSGELFVEHFRQVYGLETASLRLGSVYGPGMRPRDIVAKFMHQAQRAEPLTVLDGGLAAADFVYVDDVSWAVEQALISEAVGFFNIGSGTATTIRELAEAIAKVHSDRQVQVDILPSSKAPYPSGCALDISRAQVAWSYAPRSLEEGLRIYTMTL